MRATFFVVPLPGSGSAFAGSPDDDIVVSRDWSAAAETAIAAGPVRSASRCVEVTSRLTSISPWRFSCHDSVVDARLQLDDGGFEAFLQSTCQFRDLLQLSIAAGRFEFLAQ